MAREEWEELLFAQLSAADPVAGPAPELGPLADELAEATGLGSASFEPDESSEWSASSELDEPSASSGSSEQDEPSETSGSCEWSASSESFTLSAGSGSVSVGVVPAVVGASPGPVAVARAGLEGLGLSPDAAAGLVEVVCAQVAAEGTETVGVPVPATEAEMLSAVGAMARFTAGLEAAFLVSVQDLVMTTGSSLLAQKGVVDASLMSKTAHQTWRVSAKSAAAAELSVKLGLSGWQARSLVAVATSPGAIRSPILEALRRGEVTRAMVLKFWNATRRLTVEQAAAVSVALFGTDAGAAAVERLDVDGALDLGRPWHHHEYYAALAREIARASAEDEDAAEDDRQAARQTREARVDIGQDGLAVLTASMDTVTAVAVMTRIEDMARRARAGGDKRTLAQLRSDIIAILLLHGIITLPGDHPCGCPNTHDTTHDNSGDNDAGEEASTRGQGTGTSGQGAGASGDSSDPTAGGSDVAGCGCGCPGGESGREGLFDQIITPEDIAGLAAIITATPAGHVDLVIPWDAALGAVCPTCQNPMTSNTDTDEHGQARGDHRAHHQPQGDECAHHQGQRDHRACDQPQGDDCACDPGRGDKCACDPGRGDECACEPDADQSDLEPDFDVPHSGCPEGAACRTGTGGTAQDSPEAGQGAGLVGASGSGPAGFVPGTPTGRVGELIGFTSAFITPAQARKIILTPGTLVGRLLFKAADGRCIERSVARYAPDADMRRQVAAADVYGRGPGSRRPASQCELDHEMEWATHAWTAEANLNAKARADHYRKTKKLWRSIMNRRRDITWTTLLGQIAKTRSHDYRQYFERLTTLAPVNDPGPNGGEPEVDRSDLAARRDLLNQVLYAALVHRRPGEYAAADDDALGSEDWLTIGDWGHLNHTDPHGQRRQGGPPDHPTPEHILGLTDHDVDPGEGEGPDDTNTAGGTATNQTPDPTSPWNQAQARRTDDDPPPF